MSPRSRTAAAALLAAAALPAIALGQAPSIRSYTIACGGGVSTGGTGPSSIRLTGTIGVLTSGSTITGGALTIRAGFWPGAFTCRADLDHNGAIEPADVSLFVNTWFASLVSGTLNGDFDHNGLVEPADVSLFVTTWFTALTGGC